MTRTAAEWLHDRWQSLLIGLTAVMVAASALLGLFIFATGLDTNAVVNAQDDARERSECITAYRGEWQNAIGDIVLVASRGNDPSPAQVRALERAQRHSLRVNDLCDPGQDGGVRLPRMAGG